MEARAQLRYYRSSPSKVRLVADTVRGKPVERALSSLRLSPRYAAHDLEKLIRSAMANLEQKNPGVNPGSVVVDRIEVTDGPRLRRGRPAAEAANRAEKRSCSMGTRDVSPSAPRGSR